MTATAYNGDADELYVFICDQYRDNIAIARVVLRTLTVTTNPFTSRPHDRLGPETFMHGVWCPTTKSFVVFMMGTNLGFDQVVSIDVTTGEGKFLSFDLLSDKMLGFQCDDSTKTCDALQTSTYDFTQNRIYFQATQYQGTDDDIGETVLMYFDMNYPTHPYIDTGLAPFTFGFMDFTWVPIIA